MTVMRSGLQHLDKDRGQIPACSATPRCLEYAWKHNVQIDQSYGHFQIIMPWLGFAKWELNDLSWLNFLFYHRGQRLCASCILQYLSQQQKQATGQMHWDTKQHPFSGSSLTNWFSIRNLLKHEAKGSLLFWHFKIPACLVFLKQPHIMLNLENNLYKITGYIYCELRKYSAACLIKQSKNIPL